MKIVCPTVTAVNPHQYREQIERVAPFAKRIHIDLADGVFTDNKLLGLQHVWWPAGITVDMHLMYETIKPFMTQLIELRPSMVIVQAESVGNFYEIAQLLKEAGIRVGVALLQRTTVKKIVPALRDIDHVLVFSGHLGHFGGTADLSLLEKVNEIRKHNKEIEIGWDGGISSENIAQLARAGVDVLNVGGAIQKAASPLRSYKQLQSLIQQSKHML